MNDHDHGDSLVPVMTAAGGIFFGGTVAFALYGLGLYQPLVPVLTIASFAGGVVGFVAGLLTRDRLVGLTRFNSVFELALIIVGVIVLILRIGIVARTDASQTSLDALIVVLLSLFILSRRRSSYVAASAAALLSATTLYYAVAYRNPLPLVFTVLGAGVVLVLIRRAKGPRPPIGTTT